MTAEFHVKSIEGMPVYLVSRENPSHFSAVDLVSGIPLRELLARVEAPDKLCLVGS